MAKLTITYTSDDAENSIYALREIKDVAYGDPSLQVSYTEGEYYPKSLTITGEKAALEGIFRYFYTSDERVLSAAENIEYRKYRAIIENAAKGIRDEIAAGDFESADDDALTESIDGYADVIYYSEASLTLRHSKNDGAYESETGEAGGDECVRATYAQYADIREELGDLEELFDRLNQPTDEEKRQAWAAYVAWDAENTPGGDSPDQERQRDTCYDIAHDITDNDQRGDRLTDYLLSVLDGEETAPSST